MDIIPNEILVDILTYVPKTNHYNKISKLGDFIKLELISKNWRDVIRSYRWNFVVEPKKLHHLIHLLTYYKFHKYEFFLLHVERKIEYCDLNRLFSMLSHCTYLNLDGPGHKVTDEHLKHLVNVQHLDLTNCYHITGRYLDTLPKLKSLFLNFNEKLDKTVFTKLSQLEELSIRRCDKAGIDDEFFDSLPNLKKLELECCKRITIQGIMKLKSLESIDILLCKRITSDIIYYLKGLPHMKHISYNDGRRKFVV